MTENNRSPHDTTCANRISHRGHRFDGNCPFYDAIAANHSTGEDRACITCDGEEKWLPMHMRQAHAITGVRQWSVFGQMRHGILEILKSRRCCDLPALCFVFLFAILGNTVAQISKGQLSLIHNPKLSEKE